MSRERGTGHLFRKPGCKVWKMQYYVDGKRRRESTGTRDKTKAGQMLITRLNSVNKREEITPTSGLKRLGELFENLKLKYKLDGQVPEDLKRRLDHLLPEFEDTVADRLTTDAVNNYARKRQQEGAANATINRELGALRGAMNLARRSSPPKTKNLIKIEMLKENNVRQGFIEDEAFRNLTEACGPEQLWLRTFLELGYTYPSRKNELLGLRVEQVKFPYRKIELEAAQTKTRKRRTWVMTERVLRLLEACCTGKEAKDRVLTREGKSIHDMRDAWYGLCVRAELGEFLCRKCDVPAPLNAKKVHECPECKTTRGLRYVGLIPHDLRRSAAKRLRRAGVAESTIMAMGGWDTASMFHRYGIDSDSDQQLAINQLEKVLSPPLAPRNAEINSEAETADDAKVQ